LGPTSTVGVQALIVGRDLRGSAIEQPACRETAGARADGFVTRRRTDRLEPRPFAVAHQETAMTTEITVTGADIAAVAAKLDTLDGLTDQDRHALAAVFALAHEGLGDDVEGFALNAYRGADVSLNFTMPAPSENAILIGLLKTGAPNGIIAVRKAGGTQQEY
jgi:hypothetical protein